VIRFVIVFAMLAAASSTLETWMRDTRKGLGYQAGVARTVCALVSPLGVEAYQNPLFSEGTIFIKDHTLVITTECAAILATGLFVSAVLAFPCRWRDKVIGVITGVVGVGALNLLRIVILAVGAYYKPDRFDITHDVLMQGFLLIMVTPLWLGWLAWTMRSSPGRRVRRPGAGAGAKAG
jgi:exosortase/archaeosortase family protein